MHCLLLTVLALLALKGCLAEDRIVTGVTPSFGSIYGGTRITISGSGFYGNPLDIGGTSAGNEIFLVSDTRQYECVLHEDGCTRTQVTCYTSPMESDRYYVRIKVEGTPFPIDAYCGHSTGFHRSCSINVHSRYSPDVTDITNPYGYPDDVVTVSGKLFTDVYGSNVALGSNGNEATIVRVWLTDRDCVVRKTDNVDEFYGLALDSEDSDTGTLSCKPQGTLVGYRNLTFILNGIYGRSYPEPETLKVGRNNTIYMFQTYAPITSISHQTGSEEGGTPLTIVGKYFDEPMKVMVGDEECTDLEMTREADHTSTVTCKTPPKHEPTAFKGNRGVFVESWFGTDQHKLTAGEISNKTDQPNNTMWYQEFKWEEPDNGTFDQDNYATRSRAFFLTPQDGRYMFLLRADTDATLYVSENGDPESKVEAITDADTWGTVENSDKSPEYTFTKDQKVYLEVVHTESSKRAGVQLAVLLKDTTFTQTQSGQVYSEEATIETTSVIKNEIQHVLLENTPSGNGVSEQHTFTLSSESSQGQENSVFSIELLGYRTVNIPGDASETTVKNALNNLAFVDHKDTGSDVNDVFVAKVDTSGNDRTVTVTCPEFKGSYGDMEVHTTGDLTTGSPSVARVGKSAGSYMNLMQNNYIYRGVAYSNINANKVANSLKSGVRCPRYLLKDLHFLNDYESNSIYPESGTRTNEVMPFCGQFSSMNPSFIYRAITTEDEDGNDVWKRGILLDRYPVMCFAFRGSIEEKVWLLYKLNGGEDLGASLHDITAYTDTSTSGFVQEVNTDGLDWRYRCLNLLTLLQSGVNGLTTAEILQVNIYNAADDKDIDPLYIDVVSFSSNVPAPSGITLVSGQNTNDMNSLILYQRMMPDKWFIGDVVVTSNGSLGYSDFIVDITVLNCEENHQIFRLAHAEVSGESSVETTSSYAGLAGSRVRVISVEKASPPVSGKFSLAWDGGYSLTGLNVNIEATHLAGGIAALSDSNHDFGQVEVTRSGTCSSYEWKIVHSGKGGDHPNIEVSGTSNLQPSSASVVAKTEQEGGVYFDPIPGDMLATAHTDSPQVQVYIHELLSECTTDCGFSYSADATPVLSASSPASAPPGDSLTLTGTGFSATLSENRVVVGGVDCVVTAAGDQSITCTLGNGPAGVRPIEVTVTTKGLARHEGGPHTLEYPFSVTNLSPSQGSLAGGLVLTVTGTSFSPDTIIKIGNNVCERQGDATYDTIVCLVPKGDALGALAVTGENDPLPTASGPDFEYESPVGTITNVDVTDASVYGGTVAVITGTGFRVSGDQSITLGGVAVEIVDYQETSIEVKWPAHTQGVYPIQLKDGDDGYADNGGFSVTYRFEVNNVYPTSGSAQGGTVITLTGHGFNADADVNNIMFGDIPCAVVGDTSSTTEITCELAFASRTHVVTNQGINPAFHTPGYAWAPVYTQARLGDKVAFSWTTPSQIQGQAPRIAQTANMSAEEDLNAGFSSGDQGIANGNMDYIVWSNTVPKSVYFWSGYVNEDEDIFYHGKLELVERQQDEVLALKYMIGDLEAEYTASGGNPASGACTDNTPPGSGCLGLSNPDDEDDFAFVPRTCQTAQITSVSPSEITADEEIVITGQNFGTCDNEVFLEKDLYRIPCEIQSSSPSEIRCIIKSTCNSLPAGVPLSVDVRVGNLGWAMYAQDGSKVKRAVIVGPHVSDVYPSSGSTLGGLNVTMTGSNFMYDPENVCSPSIGARKRRSAASDAIQNMGGSYSYSLSIPGCSGVQIVDATTIICTMAPASSPVSLLPTVTTQVGSFTAGCTATGGSTCAFSPSASLNPQVTNVNNHPITAAGQQITVQGSLLGSVSTDPVVTLGDSPCTVGPFTSTELSCEMDAPVAGTHELSVMVQGVGLANINPAHSLVAVTGSITTVTPNPVGVGGGLGIDITGFGFHPDDTEVTIDGDACLVTSVSFTSIDCINPALAAGTYDLVVSTGGHTLSSTITYVDGSTPIVDSITPDTGVGGDTITIAGSNFGSVQGDISVSVGGEECAIASVFSDTSFECQLDGKTAGLTAVQVLAAGRGLAVPSVPGALNFTYELELASITPNQGSTGGGQTVTVAGEGFAVDGTSLSLCGNPCDVTSSVIYTTFECMTPPADSHGQSTCDAVVTLESGETFTLSDAYTYQTMATITNVTPRHAGTGGGKTITIQGTNFGNDMNTVTVSMAGTECAIVNIGDTEITCTTGAHKPAQETTVSVQLQSSGIAYQGDNAFFEYIDLWSSEFTWGGGPLPEAGDLVVIPADMKVRLDVDTPIMKLLLIQGIVEFDGESRVLNSEIILVTDGGTLRAGTKEEPYPAGSIADIVLHGHVRSKELPIYGTKSLSVREGTLDLHGQDVLTSWTDLEESVSAGESSIVVRGDISQWQNGASIVIASTGHHQSQNENEERIIGGISGQTVSLTEALEYDHMGETLTLGTTGQTLEARAEVGYLTRNVRVSGSNDDQWHDVIEACPEGFNTGEFAIQTCFEGRFGEEIGSDQFGAMIMVHAPTPAANESEEVAFLRMSNVEMTYVGQAFRLGRYTIHLHINGYMGSSYIESCAAHRTFNRFVNLHATHYVRVERNVAYDVMGGAYFLEDGVEMYNEFIRNLAIFVRSSTSLQNDDITPAAYWITNAYNRVEGNHAAGGTHFGMWYRMHSDPDGPSFVDNYFPQRVPLLENKDNVVHSQGWFAVWIFEKFHPMTLLNADGSGFSEEPVGACFENLRAWNCEKGFESVVGGAIQVKGAVIVNSAVAGIEYKLVGPSTPYSDTKGPKISDTLIYGRHDDLKSDNPDGQNFGVVLPQGRGLVLEDMTYGGFDTPTSCVYTVANVQGVTAIYNGGYTYMASGHVYDDDDTCVTSWRWPHDGLIIDMDGSVSRTNNAGTKILPGHGDLPNPGCQISPTIDGLTFDRGAGGGAVCDPQYEFTRFGFNEVLPSNTEGKNVSFRNEYGEQLTYYRDKGTTHKEGWHAFLLKNHIYAMAWVNAEQLTNLSYSGVMYDLGPDESVTIEHHFYQDPDVFTITGEEDVRNMSLNPLNAADNRYGDWHIPTPSSDADGNLVYISSYIVDGEREMPHDNNTEVVYADKVDRSVDLRVYRCLISGCLEPLPFDETAPPTSRDPNYVLWSNNSVWSNENGVWTANKDTGNLADAALPDDTATDIYVHKDTWLLINESPNFTFGRVTVNGVLEFEWALRAVTSGKRSTGEQLTLEFSCTHLLISGGRLIIGFESTPMLNNVIINLVGDQFTKDIPIQNGPNVGAKAIGVFGAFEAHGKETVVGWTRLGQTAMANMKELRLDDSHHVDDMGWEIGDDIVIAATGFAPGESEVHKIKSIQSRANSIILEDPLKFKHLGETVLDIGNGETLQVAAEVGRLTRNIKIRGVNSDPGGSQDMHTTGFGGRIIAGAFSRLTEEGEAETFTGYMRLRNVELQNMGQEGWHESYDPRYSLAYVNTEEVTDIKPSEVVNCSIWEGFNTAIGAFGAYNLKISGNVIYRTVGSGIIVWESGHKLENNLVIGSTYPGTFNGRTEQRDIWVAGYELNQVTDLTLVGNVAADHERGGFRVDGEVCGEERKWFDNVAHTGIAGVFQLPDMRDGVAPCGRIAGFYVYHHFDWGMYLQSFGSLEMEDNILLENNVGSFALIYGPSAVNHEYEDRFLSIKDSIYVGATNIFERDSLDYVLDDPQNKFYWLLFLTSTSRAWRIGGEGMSGASSATFSQGNTASPRKPMNNIKSYHSIRGKTEIEDTRFYNYKTSTDGVRDYAITTPSKNDDGIHPTYLQGVSAIDCDEESLVYNHQPNIGKIDPSNCVDMECDGLNKWLVKDLTGGFLQGAEPGKPTSVISYAEWEWDGDRRRGLGDYRIPKVLLSDVDGNRVDIDLIAQERGIPRNPDCELVDAYQAWLCPDLDYEMLQIESLDDDSETRRVSPVAFLGPLAGPDYTSVVGSGTAQQPVYVDLVNGPQDHGWCFGYTCQKRLSLFPFLVMPGSNYQVVFTGTTPMDLALHWLNTDDTQAAVLGIWYSRPYRLNVYRGNTYVPPTNTDPNYGLNDLRLLKPLSDVQYLPDVNTHPAGTNLYDREEQYLYVLVRGSNDVITVLTDELIFVNFEIPMLTVDEFFGPAIVENLAAFFDIPASKIRIATAVPESRKKRQDVLQVTIEIGNDPHDLTDVDPSDLTTEELHALAERILRTYQLDELDEVLQLDILTFNMVEPPPGSDSETWQVMAELGTSPTITATIPQTMEFEQELKSLHEGTAFSTQPILKMKDANGDVVSALGTMASPWEITASLFAVESDWDEATLIGSETVQYRDGQFVFSDLGVSHSGSYRVTFTVTSPTEASHFSLESQDITVSDRKLAAAIVSQPEMATVDREFNVTVEIVDAVTGEKVEDVAWKGHTWEVSLSLYMPEIYNGDVSTSMETVAVDSATGEAVFHDVSISDYGRYFLAFEFTSDPSDFSFSAPADLWVDVYPKDYEAPEREVLHHIVVKFDGDFDAVVSGRQKYFHAAAYNKLWYEYTDVEFSNFDSEAGSILVSFDVAGGRAAVDGFVDSLWAAVEEGEYTLEFAGHTLTSTGEMWVDGESLREDKDKMHVALIVVIVILAVALVAAIVGFVIYKYCKSRAEQNNFRLQKREPTAVRRKTGHVTDDYYSTVGMPGYGSHSSLSSDGQENNDEKPIVASVPPKSTNFDFVNVRPKTSYKAPGALPPLEHRGSVNPDLRPVSSTHLDISLVANSPAGGLPRVDSPHN